MYIVLILQQLSCDVIGEFVINSNSFLLRPEQALRELRAYESFISAYRYFLTY